MLDDTKITLLSILAIPIAIIFDAFVLKIVYNWYIPVLFDIFPLTLSQAIGIVFVKAVFLPQPESEKDPLVIFLAELKAGVLILFIAWAARWLVI